MRLPPHHPTTVLSLILLLPSLVTPVSIDCSDVRTDGTSWNLETLGGPHSLYTIDEYDSQIKNTTFTLDICQPLSKAKGGSKLGDCPNHSRVCAIRSLKDTIENDTLSTDTIPIAGDYGLSTGGNLDPKWTRLKSSDSPADRKKEGVRLEVHGGKYEGKKQKAFIDFICIPKQEGERILDDDDKDRSGEEVDDEHGGNIKFMSWEDEGDAKALRLEWHTSYACEDAVAGNDRSSGGHWGFFTWFILIAFMGIAAYLIFGSWLNYNRYSARGWDLVPHSDTIRDIPYLFRDWIRRVADTVQGGGSRGGYSAV